MPQAGPTPQFRKDATPSAWDVVPWAPTAAGKSRIAVHRWCSAWRAADDNGDTRGLLKEANERVDTLAGKLGGSNVALVHVTGENPAGMLEQLLRVRQWRVHALLLTACLPYSVRKGGLCFEKVLTVPLPRRSRRAAPRNWAPLMPGDTPAVLDTALTLLGDGMPLRDAVRAARVLG